MRRVVLPMRMTLDGYATGPHGEMDWIPVEDPTVAAEQWDEIWRRLRSIDTLLLGRVTYQVWERYWPAVRGDPSSGPNEVKFARWVEQVPKVVFSRTLRRASWNGSRIVRDDAVTEVARMKQRTGKDLALPGGAGLAQFFARSGLIDDYLITVDPVLIGIGRPLFGQLGVRRGLELVGSRSFRSGAVLLHYRPIDRGSPA